MKRSRFRALMDALLRTMRRQVRNAVVQQGVPVTLEQREQLASAMLPAIRRARAQSHALGAQMLETQAQALEIPAPPVQPVRRYERQAVVTMLEDVTLVSDRSSNATVTVDDLGEVAERRPRVSVTVVDPESRRSSRVSVEVTEDNRRDPEVVKVIADKVQAVAERHARMPSREAFTDAVESDDDDDGPEVGWARVLTGAESCGFCAMLASRGPVYKSKKTASDAGGVDGKAYHDNCDCEVVLVREDQDWVGREEYEALEQLWASSTAGTNGKSALKAFTAALNQEIVDGTAGRFIADPDRDTDAPFADVKPEVERADDYGPTRQGETVPFTPSDAPKLAEAVRNHILHGDDDDIESGGHLFGVGRAKKTEFPERWSAERIEQAVDEVLAQPDRIESQAGTYLFHRQIDRVNVRVVVKSRGAKARIVSAYPINGDGVMKNRERGGKSRMPLRAVPLQKWPAVGSQP